MGLAMAKKRQQTALFDEPVAADDVVVCAVRLADAIAARVSVLFAEHGLTTLQYNVLRILYVRDPEGEGLAVGAIRDRLMVRGPDVTRLINRLEKAGLVERFRPSDDRRVVKVRLTATGVDRVEVVHPLLVAHNCELFARIPQAELEQLAQLLAKALEAIA